METPALGHSWRSPNEIDHMNWLDDECFASTYTYRPVVRRLPKLDECLPKDIIAYITHSAHRMQLKPKG